jgi:hypothetical protein
VFSSATAGGFYDAASQTLTTGTIALDRPTNNLLLAAFAHQSDNHGVTMSNYQVTSGGSNPTWTEVQDTTFDAASGGTEISIATAYANDTDLTDITEFEADAASSTTGDPEGWAMLLLVIAEPSSTTATHALHTGSTGFFGNSTTFGGTGTHSVLATSPTFPAGAATAVTPGAWSNSSRPSLDVDQLNATTMESPTS